MRKNKRHGAITAPVERLVIAFLRLLRSDLFIGVGTAILTLTVLLFFGIAGVLCLLFIAFCGVIYSAVACLVELSKYSKVFKKKCESEDGQYNCPNDKPTS